MTPAHEPAWKDLFAEVRRRRVFRVVIAYAAAAFVSVQAAQIYFPALGFPEWTFRAVVVLSLLGLPVATFLAWVFDITPAGVRRTGPAADPSGELPHPEPLVAARLAPIRLAAAAAVAVLAVAGATALALRDGGAPLGARSSTRASPAGRAARRSPGAGRRTRSTPTAWNATS